MYILEQELAGQHRSDVSIFGTYFADKVDDLSDVYYAVMPLSYTLCK